MKIKKNIKRIVLRSLIISVGIVLTSLLFSAYIKHVFKVEIDDKLIEAAEAYAYNTTLGGEFNECVVDAKGRFIRGNSSININHKAVQLSLNEETNRMIWGKLADKATVNGRAIGTVYLNTGDPVYVGIVPLKENKEYYAVSFLPKSVVNNEFKPIIWIILSFCILVGLLILLGISNYYVVKYLNYKKQLNELASSVEYDDNALHKHKKDIMKAINQNKEQYAYTVISIRNYLFMSELFGYDYGENIVKCVFECISNELKNPELVTRISPINFGVLLLYEDELSFRIRLNSILKKAGKVSSIDKNNLNTIIFSCGVYIIKEGDNYKRIINCAMDAMKCQVVQEKNNILFYDEVVLKGTSENKDLLDYMMDALEQGEFQVYLQPKFEVDSDQMIGAEALLRWLDKSGKVIYPSAFLPIFEAYGCMDVIDLYVLRNISRMQNQRKKDGKKEIVFSMNISSQTIKEKGIMERIISIVDEYRVSHSLIEFEFSELVVYENKDYVQNIILSMKEAGFYVTLDNFGSGYSAIDEFKNIPFDIIKLDKDLLKEFNYEEGVLEDRLIINHIIGAAKELHTNILAKGVETEFQRKFVQEANCKMVQGFIYARPMPYEKFNNFDS